MAILKYEGKEQAKLRGVSTTKIYTHYIPDGTEAVDDLVVLGYVSYNVKVKSLLITADGDVDGAIVLVDDNKEVATTPLVADVIVEGGVAPVEYLYGANTDKSLKEIVETEPTDYEGAYLVAFKLNSVPTADFYVTLEYIDNI
jgi:hypothetical protein